MSLNVTTVDEIPDCDFCPSPAAYDGKTVHGHWAYMCPQDFVLHGTGLGLGRGQRLVLASGPEPAPESKPCSLCDSPCSSCA